MNEEELDELEDEEFGDNVIDGVDFDTYYTKTLTKGNDAFAAVPFEALDNNAKRRVKYHLKKKLKGQGDAKSKSWNVEEINGYELYGLAMPPYNLENLVDLSVENDTHYACIRAKCINIVGIGYKWKERRKVKEARMAVEEDDTKMIKLARKLTRVTESLDEWIEELNLEEDFNEILYNIWFDVEATGNGYMEIGRQRNGQIGYIGHVPSKTMRVRKDRDGYIQIVQDKTTFFRNFGDRSTPDYFGKDPQPNEIVHFKKHTSKNIYYGVPDVIAAMTAIAGQKFAGEYNLDYFENKAVPRYALIVKGAKLSAAAERKILEYFRKEVRGKHHGTLYIPVPAHMGSNVDVKLEAIENKVQEAGFEKYRAGNHESIAMVHGVPKSWLGIGVGVAAAREDDKKFKTGIVRPEQRRVAKKVNRVVREHTDMYLFEFEELDLLDAETRSRIHDRYIRLGIESPNEARAEVGYMPRKGGDRYVNVADESKAKVDLTTSQAGLASEQTKAIGNQPKEDPRTNGNIPPGKGVKGPGPDRKTTDGSPKDKQPTSTPAKDTPQGKGTRGTAADKGEVPKSTER